MKIEDNILSTLDIDRKVKYIPTHAHGVVNHPDVEYGYITSWNEKFVFVRYGSDINSKATSPEDLIWSL